MCPVSPRHHGTHELAQILTPSHVRRLSWHEFTTHARDRSAANGFAPVSSTDYCLMRLLEIQADYISNPLLCAEQISLPESLLKDDSDLWDSPALIEMCEELITRPFPLLK